MSEVTCVGLVCAVLAAAIVGCGDTTTAATSSDSAAVNSDSAAVNGCDPATAEDQTANASVTVMFGGSLGLKYMPACIRIKPGSSVTFTGSFASHPLVGGTDGTVDASSPITQTTTGMTATFNFPHAGTFPYFCAAHYTLGMEGAVFVE
jgi:plastocyanin